MSSDKFWWYLDVNGNCTGPVQGAEIVLRFHAGEIDGLTLVHEDENGDAKRPPERTCSKWMNFSEVEEFRLAVKSNEDELDLIDSLGADSLPETDARFHGKLSPKDMVPPPSKPIVEKDVFTSGEFQMHQLSNGHESSDKTDDGKIRRGGSARLVKKRKRALAKVRDWARRSIHVSAIPADADEAEIVQYFTKCGVLMPEARTGRPSVYLQKDDQTGMRQARVTYAMEPSVENALLLLDGTPLRHGGAPLEIERVNPDNLNDTAMSNYDGTNESSQPPSPSTKRPRTGPHARSSSEKLKHAPHLILRQALGWAEDDQIVGRSLRIVVLRNLFDPTSGTPDYNSIQEDVETGCAECGPVEKVTIFEGNLDGVAVVRFRDGQGARKCLELMQGRWFDQRRIEAEYYDGITDYRVKESEDEKQERLKRWERWVSEQDSDRE